MPFSVEFTEQCETDLDDIVSYLVANAPITANRFGNGFDLLIARLREYPESAPAFRGELRRAVVPGVDYVVFYDVLPDRIRVQAVAHGSRFPNEFQ